MKQATLWSVVNLPSRIYQSHRPFWKRLFLAAGWVCLYALFSGTVYQYAPEGSLPSQWQIVIAALVFITGLWSPAIGYLAFVAAMAYPLYRVSIYVMALTLAPLFLLSPLVFVRAERATLMLLILSAPLLAPFHLIPLVPLLAGLWWGPLGGCIGGVGAALWLKLCASLSGSVPDLWHISGWTMTIAPLYERFHAANSLQTVVRMVEPLWTQMEYVAHVGETWPGSSQTGVFLLFHLLQVLAWAAAGYVVGFSLEHMRIRRAGIVDGISMEQGATGLPTEWGAMTLSALSLGPGLVFIWAGYVAVPTWLHVYGPRWFDPLWLPAQVLWAGFVGWCLESLLQYLERPILPYRWHGYADPAWRPLAAPEPMSAGGRETEAVDVSHLDHARRQGKNRRWLSKRDRFERSGVKRKRIAASRDPLELLKQADGGASHPDLPEGGHRERGASADIMIELD